MTNAMMRAGMAMILCAAGGCALEGDDDAEVGTADQAVSSFGIWSWGCSGSSPCALDLGVAAGQTCFLAGVQGNLQHPGGAPSGVQVLRSNVANSSQLHWGLQITPNSHPLAGWAVCIPGDMVSSGQWHNGQAAVNLGPTADGRRCFLTGIRNTNGMTAANHSIEARISGASWILTGTLPAGADVTANAVCVVTAQRFNDFAIVAGEDSTFLNQTIQTGSGLACGLRKLGGHFVENSFSTGAWIDFNNSGPSWNLNVVDGKQAVTYCVK